MRCHPIVAAVLAMVAAIGPARAGDPPSEAQLGAMAELEQRMLAAEAAARTARDSRALADYDGCGEAYLAVAAAARPLDPDHVPDALYNAATCFVQGGSPEPALAAFAALAAGFPKHRLAAMAMPQVARLHWVLGDVAAAADGYETFAARYAGEAEARDALADAIVLRAALGDLAAADRDADRWIMLYGKKAPREASALELHRALARREAGAPMDVRDARAAIAALEGWLRHYGGHGERGEQAMALRALGELTWDQSCPRVRGGATAGAPATAMHLCLRPAPPGPRCATTTAPLRVVPRDPVDVARARKALAMAVHVGETDPDGGGWIGAGAQLVLGSAAIEAALALAPPVPEPAPDAGAGAVTPTSAKAMARWFATWRRALGQAEDAIAPVLTTHYPRIAVLAASRTAWLRLAAADQLAAAPLPAVRRGDGAWRAAYCAAIADEAAPLYAAAREAAEACLALAARTDVVDEAAACLQVLDRLTLAGNAAAPAARERLPAPAPANAPPP